MTLELEVGKEYRVRVHRRENGGVHGLLVEATDTVRVMRLDAVEPTHLVFSYEGKVARPDTDWSSHDIIEGRVEWQDGRIKHQAYAFEVLDVAA